METNAAVVPQCRVISDREVLHRSDARGVRITRVQIVEVDGQRFKCDFWTQWENGKLIRVDSNPIAA